MSAVEGLPAPLPSVEPEARRPRPDALPSLCPYLATPDGNWRSATAAREHRCTAVSPPVQLAPEKQRRLCLVADHVNCATYGAALAAHSSSAERLTGYSRPIARMTPVILDQGRLDLRIPTLRADRPSSQAVLVGVLGLALVAILLARPSGDSGVSVSPGSSVAAPTDAAAGRPTAVPVDVTDPPASPAPTVVPSVSPAPSTAPSARAPSAVPSASASAPPEISGATYRVKSGDNLYSIAARFGTTINVLIELNDLADPSKLKVGQTLRLP